jgi:hypothetical protein
MVPYSAQIVHVEYEPTKKATHDALPIPDQISWLLLAFSLVYQGEMGGIGEAPTCLPCPPCWTCQPCRTCWPYRTCRPCRPCWICRTGLAGLAGLAGLTGHVGLARLARLARLAGLRTSCYFRLNFTGGGINSSCASLLHHRPVLPPSHSAASRMLQLH